MSAIPLRDRALFLLRRINHLALAAGLYPAGALLAAAQITTRDVRGLTILCAWATGSSVYLLDRVKLADRFFDRADLAADRDRFEWISAHSRKVRTFGAALAIAALILSILVHPAAPLLVLAGHIAVVAYAHRSADPERPPRPKDVFLIKNLLVGTGIAFFAVALLALDGRSAAALEGLDLRLLAPFLFLAAVITADAALSDVDDVLADRPFGTRTVPAAAGRRATLILFITANVLAGAALAAWARATQGAGGPLAVYAWSLFAPLTALAFILPRSRALRPYIDARLPLLALLFTAI